MAKEVFSFFDLLIRQFLEKTLNNMLRRHFVELTDSFLLPLNEYFESLIVGSHTRMTLSTLRTKPEIRPFKQESFLKAIELNGT